MDFFTSIIFHYGYLGIFVLMFLESASFPLPSEVILPVVGLLAREKLFDVNIALLISIVGSIFGAILDYYIAKFLGKEYIYSKAKHLKLEHHLQKAEKFLNSHPASVLFARFIPAVRALISIPAGLSEMNFAKFVSFSLIGIVIYNSALIYSFNYFILPLMVGIGVLMTALYLYMYLVYDKH